MKFTDALQSLVHQLLDRAEIPYSQIEYRAKEVPSFVEKLKRKNEKYENPLHEVTDLVGVRVVLFYLDDIERVSSLIEREFDVDPDHSGDKSAALDPDRFGYLSVHQILRLSPNRISLPEWESFGDIYVEIQVRTVLQHAWAAISRKLAYANVRDAPRKLQRNLNRLSALFELADDEFLAIRQAREEIEAQHKRKIRRGKFEAALHLRLEKTGQLERVEALARKAGSTAEDSKVRVDGGAQRFERSLLAAADRIGLTTVAEFEEKLDELWDAMPDFMANVNARYRDSDGQPMSPEPHNWLTLILLWSIRAPAEVYRSLGYVNALVDVITAYRGPSG